MANSQRKPAAKPVEAAPKTPVDETVVIPEPTAIKGSWFPATVTLPGQQPRAKAKVYAAVEGLYVYFAVPPFFAETGTWGPPEFYSPADYSQLDAAPSGYAARNGFTIVTDAGIVGITASGACGCGWPLKKWVPEFAKRIVRW